VVPKFNLSILLDGAHNTAGAESLRSFLDQQTSVTCSSSSGTETEGSTCWIVGLKSDKDASKILSILLRQGDAFLSVPFTMPQDMPWVKCADPTTLVKTAEGLGLRLSYSDSFESVERAVEFVALGDGGGNSNQDGFKREMYKNVVVCGSLYLVSDVYRTIA
jgi:folylpolyglutamate synthase/dihydropteroate synthase